jgi:hypothetical protein
MTTLLQSESVADFLRVRNHIKNIATEAERFVITNLYCAAGKVQEFQKGSSYNFVLNMTFVEKENATQEDIAEAVDLSHKGFFPELDFDFILSALLRVNTGEAMATSPDPLLVHLESDSGMAVDTRGRRNYYQLSIKVRATDAENFDSIKRKPFNPDNVPTGAHLATPTKTEQSSGKEEEKRS